MSHKFEKNRSVDYRYFAVPVKYCLDVKGKHSYCVPDREDFETAMDKARYKYLLKELQKNEFPEKMWEYTKDNDIQSYITLKFEADEFCPSDRRDEYKQILEDAKNIKIKLKNQKKEYDKDFVILDFYGKRALCAWRNNNTCKIGMTFMCPIIHKEKKTYLKYKNQLISLNDKSGWVF